MSKPFPGDFQLVHTGGEGGKLIHLGEILNGDGFADYEHARLYLGNGKFVEAEPGGAVIRQHPLDEGLWSTGKIELTDEERRMICAAGTGYEGTGYSPTDYFAIASVRLKFGLLIPGLKAYVQSSKHMICSQLVDQCYQDAGVHLFTDNRWPGYVTPADLANLLLSKV